MHCVNVHYRTYCGQLLGIDGSSLRHSHILPTDNVQKGFNKCLETRLLQFLKDRVVLKKSV